jgi:transposase-like protein
MKPQDFRDFLARLDELTPDQKAALASVMAGSRTDAIAIIEARFGEGPFCPHCASRDIAPWGSTRDLKRHRCLDCSRTFTALTGTPLAGLHKRHMWLAYAEALVRQETVRSAAVICGIDKTTSFRWRHRLLEAPCVAKPKALRDIVEADETFFLESFKGAPELPRPARKRGGKAKKRGLSAEQIPILIVRDRHGATTDSQLSDLSDKSIADVLGPIVNKEVVLVSDGAERFRRFADKADILHVSLNASAGERTWGVYHIQNANAYTSRLKAWMIPFKGVATKYLPNYLGWRRQVDMKSLSPEACLAAALG